MKKYKTIQQPTQQLTELICDRCGKQIANEDGIHEGASFSLSFGYGSRYDLTTWAIDTCDDCAMWLAKEFKGAF